MKINKSTLIGGSVIVGAALLTGCSSDNTDKTNLRIIHASADAPAVDVKLNDVTAVSGLDYPQSTGFVSINAATYDVAVDAIVGEGSSDMNAQLVF